MSKKVLAILAKAPEGLIEPGKSAVVAPDAVMIGQTVVAICDEGNGRGAISVAGIDDGLGVFTAWANLTVYLARNYQHPDEIRQFIVQTIDGVEKVLGTSRCSGCKTGTTCEHAPPTPPDSPNLN